MVCTKDPSKATNRQYSTVTLDLRGRNSRFHLARFQIICHTIEYFHAFSRSSDLEIVWKNAKHYSRCYGTDSELILAQFEPIYEIEANPPDPF